MAAFPKYNAKSGEYQEGHPSKVCYPVSIYVGGYDLNLTPRAFWLIVVFCSVCFGFYMRWWL